MGLEQRKLNIPNTEVHEIEDHRQLETKRKVKRKLFSPGEKFLFVVFTVVLVLFSSTILHNESKLNDMNREVQAIGTKITNIEKQNTELSIQVKEKSTYEVVWEKAKELGLHLNENNVKVVPGR